MKISKKQQKELDRSFGKLSFKKKVKVYISDEIKTHIKLTKKGLLNISTKHKTFGCIGKYKLNRKGKIV